jgi:hypothetical protein
MTFGSDIAGKLYAIDAMRVLNLHGAWGYLFAGHHLSGRRIAELDAIVLSMRPDWQSYAFDPAAFKKNLALLATKLEEIGL